VISALATEIPVFRHFFNWHAFCKTVHVPAGWSDGKAN
jgi:hypothetical protein